MTIRRYLLVLTISLGFAATTKGLQVALTPEAWEALAGWGERLLASSGFGFLLVGTACAFLLSCAAAAWERAERGESTCGYCGRKAAQGETWLPFS